MGEQGWPGRMGKDVGKKNRKIKLYVTYNNWNGCKFYCNLCIICDVMFYSFCSLLLCISNNIHIHSQSSHMMRCDTTTPISFARDVSHRVQLLYISSFHESIQASACREDRRENKNSSWRWRGCVGTLLLHYEFHENCNMYSTYSTTQMYIWWWSEISFHCSPHGSPYIKLLHLFNFFVCVNLYY